MSVDRTGATKAQICDYVGPHSSNIGNRSGGKTPFRRRKTAKGGVKLWSDPTPEHPDTLMAMNNLAIGYQDAGRKDEALKLFESALAWIFA